MSFAKKKGYRGEKELEEWMIKVSGGIQYRRTPASGAMHQDFPHDIMKRDPRPSIFDGIGNEMKNTKRIQAADWIEQAEIAARDAGQFIPKFFVAFKHKGTMYFILNKAYYEEILAVQREHLTNQE